MHSSALGRIGQAAGLHLYTMFSPIVPDCRLLTTSVYHQLISNIDRVVRGGLNASEPILNRLSEANAWNRPEYQSTILQSDSVTLLNRVHLSQVHIRFHCVERACNSNECSIAAFNLYLDQSGQVATAITRNVYSFPGLTARYYASPKTSLQTCHINANQV